MNPFYPEIISELPEADIPFNGVRGWLSQGKDHQIVFFEIEPIGEVAAHKHGAQWGAVFDGEMELTMPGTRPKAEAACFFCTLGFFITHNSCKFHKNY